MLRVSSPGIEPGPRPSQSRVRIHHTPRTIHSSSTPPRSRTSSNSFENCHALHHTRRACVLRNQWLYVLIAGYVFRHRMSEQRSEQTRHACATTGPGIEVAKFTPRPASRVARSGIEPDPAASEAAVRSTTLTSQIVEYPDLESNQNLDFRRVPCGPLHHQGSKGPTAGFAPA